MDDKITKNILLRLWTDCIEAAAKAIRFTYVAGIKDGVVVEASITHEYRRALFTSLIDLQSRIDLIYGAGVEAAPAYKKLLKQHYSFSEVPSNSIIRRIQTNTIKNDVLNGKSSDRSNLQVFYNRRFSKSSNVG